MKGRQGRLTDAAAAAEVLRAQPPQLDELAQARIEKRLLAELRRPGVDRVDPERPVGRRFGRYAAFGAAAAAAALLGFFALRSPEPEVGREARMELRTVGATVQSGTIDEGSSLRTGADEVADIRIEDSRLHLEPSTEVRIEALTDGRLAFELRSGEIRVEFHPRVRGEERMTVRTSRAMVEVVGTVFTVRETGQHTEVAVSEGRVRVTPHGAEPRSVGAGESTRVQDAPLAETAPALPEAESEVESEAESELPPPAAVRERRVETAAVRLRRARRLLRQGQSERAATLLRELSAAREVSPAIRAQSYTLLGDLLRSRRNFPAAARAFESAADQGAGPMSQMAIYALARLQERQMNDRVAATLSYHRYIDTGGGPLVGQARAALCRLGEDDQCGEVVP